MNTGLYKVKGKIAAGASLYNIKIITSIISLERHVSPPGAKGRPWIDALSGALACSGALVSGTPGLDHKGPRVEECNIYIYIYHARVEISVY